MKSARLSLRCSVEQKSEIQHAARLYKQSLSAFLRNAALREAFIVLGTTNSIKLSAEQAKIFIELDKNPFSPSAKLSNALREL